MIVKYLREKKDGEKGRGKPIGCVIALSEDKIGFSLCNPIDTWDRNRARQIAIGRANKIDIDEMLEDLFFTTDHKLTPRHVLLADTVECVRQLASKYDFDR